MKGLSTPASGPADWRPAHRLTGRRGWTREAETETGKRRSHAEGPAAIAELRARQRKRVAAIRKLNARYAGRPFPKRAAETWNRLSRELDETEELITELRARRETHGECVRVLGRRAGLPEAARRPQARGSIAPDREEAPLLIMPTRLRVASRAVRARSQSAYFAQFAIFGTRNLRRCGCFAVETSKSSPRGPRGTSGAPPVFVRVRPGALIFDAMPSRGRLHPEGCHRRGSQLEQFWT
jgi:hypothetical protein